MNRTLARKMLFLGESDVIRCLSMKECIDINRKALISIVEGGGGVVPARLGLPYLSHRDPDGAAQDWSLFKPAAYQEDSITKSMGSKIVSLRADNPSRGLPLAPATIMVLDPPSGMVKAVVGGTYLTAARTAAGSAIATELCKPDAKHLVVFGAGLQAECHIQAIQFVLNSSLERISIVNRSRERAEKLVSNLSVHVPYKQVILLNDTAKIQKVLREADIVVTCTNTQTPLFDGAFLKPGCHINGIGSYTPKMQEVDEVSVRRSRILMDTLDATTVGDLKDVLSQHSVPGTILGQALKDKGVWLSQSVPSSVDCTFYKAVGTAIQDVLTAELVVDNALEQGIGIKLDMS